MKRVGITQRVEIITGYGERRDCLDQRWSGLMLSMGWFPIPLPNVLPEQAHLLIEYLQLEALVFSGGNSLSKTDPTAADAAPERDALETALLGEAAKNDIPVLGICRGMQMINVALGGAIKPVTGHVAKDHRLNSITDKFKFPETVNSYHNFGIGSAELADSLRPLALDDEENIEAFEHSEHRIFGIMWHPEREEPASQLGIQLIKQVL